MFNRNKNPSSGNTSQDSRTRGERVANLDASLAAVEAEPIGQLLEATRAESHPRPAFVEKLKADLRQQSVQKPAGRSVRWGLGWPARRAAFVATLLVLVLALSVAGWTWLNQPAPVSAAGILARASNLPGVQSLHVIYTGEHHESAGGPGVTAQLEIWFQAPAKYRMVRTLQGQEGANQNGWSMSDGTTLWAYDPRLDEIQMLDPDPSDNILMATSLGQIIQEATHGQYDAALQGSETLLGRPAYVVELTARANSGTQDSVAHPQDPVAHSRLWVDQQLYLPLQQYNWDAAGNLLDRISMTHLYINPAIDPSLFSFVQPVGIPVRDMRQSTLWQKVAQQAGFKVFRPAPGSMAGVPDQLQYDPATGQVDAWIPVRLSDGSSVELLIDEERPVGPLPALGDPVSINLRGGQKLTGKLWVTGNQVLIGFDRDGTRIVVSANVGKENYALVLKTAQALVPVLVAH